MKESPLVSVCIPAYNGEKYLQECLDSVLLQSYRNIEVIVVDDQSTDKTVAIVKEYALKDDRIKLYINEKNLGLVGNWNECGRLSNGIWIKYVFQDDYLALSCIEQMLSAIDDKVKFVVGNRKFIFDQSVVAHTRKMYETKIVTIQTICKINKPQFISADEIAEIVSKLVSTNFVGEPTAVMFRKDVVNEIGNFNPLLVQICDLEYWLRIATNFGLYYIPSTLAFFRVHNESESANNRESERDSVDKIVLVSAFLKNDWYKKLRSNLSKHSLDKLNEMFKLRIYEVNIAMSKNTNNQKLFQHYEFIKSRLPIIAKYETPSFKTKLIYCFVKLRRKMLN